MVAPGQVETSPRVSITRVNGWFGDVGSPRPTSQPHYEQKGGNVAALTDVGEHERRMSCRLVPEGRRPSRSRQGQREKETNMHFEGKKIIVVGGSAGWVGRSRPTSSITAAAR